MQFYFPLFDQIGVPVLAGLYLFLFIMEGRRQLRQRRVKRSRHVLLNLSVSIAGFIVLRGLLLPSMAGAAVISGDFKLGLFNSWHFPAIISTVFTFALLDYSNYIWHYLSHRVPFIWRFHKVHHTDADLDVSTAVRFHFGEVLLSVVFRGGAVFLLGASVVHVLVYELLFEAGTAFHHSNWKIPFKVEKSLSRFLVTPRMHGIHHSNVPSELNSNYSVIFNFWDRVHKTLIMNVPQKEVVAGLPSYPDLKDQNFFFLMKLPFLKQTGSPNASFKKRSHPGEKTELVP